MQTTSFPIHQGCIVDSVLQPDDQCDWLVNLLAADEMSLTMPKKMTEKFAVNDLLENADTAASQKEADPEFILGKLNSSTSTF